MPDISNRTKTFNQPVAVNGALNANAGLTVSGGAAAENTWVENVFSTPSSGFTNLTLTLPRTNGNRNLVTVHANWRYSNSNGTPLNCRIRVQILDGVTVLLDRTFNFGVQTGFSSVLSLTTTAIVAKAVAANYTIRFDDVQVDGGSHGFSTFSTQASSSAMQLG